MPAKKKSTNKLPQTFQEAVKYFSDPEVANQFMARLRWPDGPSCPNCGSKEHSYLKSRRLWKCKNCKKQYSVRVGSVLEDSPLPLDKWLLAIWEIANCSNGISSVELAKKIGVTQKSAWFLNHRIRLAMQYGSFEKYSDKFEGAVEVDETYIGGKARNMHASRRRQLEAEGKLKGHSGKMGVVGFLERGGEVRAQVVDDIRKSAMQKKVREHVKPGATVITDELKSYYGLDAHFQHQIINHAERYVDGQIHTNGLENYWALLKRGLSGTYVSVRPFHLFRYLDEQSYRYNRRELEPLERTMGVVSKAAGKRLTYRELTGKDRKPEPPKPVTWKPRAFPMGPF